MPAEFRIDQVTPGAGVPGRTRHDLVPNEVITLVATSPTGPGVTYTWEILDKVGSTAVLSSTTGPSVTIGPAPSIVRPCSFRIKLTVNDNGTITSTVRRASVRTLVTGIFVPLFPESALSSGTLSSNSPDSSEDNAVYNNRAGLGIADQNWRGWAEWAYEITLAVESGGGAGGPPTGPAGGDLGDTYPNPSVRKLWGRAIENVAPNNNDYLRWDGGTVSWRPTAFPTGLPPSGAAGGDLAGNYPNPTVAQVQGFPVQSGTPSTNDIWRFNGVSWARVPHGHFIDGTEPLPSITFGADTNTGIFRPGNDRLRIVTGGSTVSEFTNFHIITQPLSAANPSYSFIGDETTGMFNPTLGEIAFSTSGIERMRISPAVLTMVGVVRTADGTVGAPAYSFTSDPDSGVYSSGVNKLAISTGGVDRLSVSTVDITSSLPVYVPVGTALAPTYSFTSDADTGLYQAGNDVIGLTSGGSYVAKFKRPLAAAAGTQVTLDLVADVGGISGTAGFDAILMNVQGAPTGSGVRRLLHFTRDGAERLQVMDAGYIRSVDGAATTPTFSFVTDDDTGAYLIGDGVYGISTAGVERVRFTLTDSQLTGNWLPEADNTRNLGSAIRRWANLHATSITTSSSTFGDGTVAAPSITFTLDTNTGFWRPGSGIVGVTGDGLEVVRFQAPAGANPQLLAASGSNTAPTYSFAADSDTGIYLNGANLGFTFNGALRYLLTNVGVSTAANSMTWSIGHIGTRVRIELNSRLDNAADTGAGVSFLQHAGLAYIGANVAQQHVLASVSLNQTGTSAFDLVRGDVTNTALGSGDQNLLNLLIGGVSVFKIKNSTTAAAQGQVQASDGAAATPTYSFVADPDTGLHRSGSGIVSVVGDGAQVLRIQAPGGVLPQVLAQGGTAANPPYSFIGSTSTGMLFLSPELAFSVAGTETMRMQAPAGVPQMLVPDGTVTAPTIGYTLDTNTGFFRPGSGIIGVTGDGLEIVRLQAPAGASPQAQFALGTAAKPSISFNDGFSTAGFYMPSAGVIGFVSGGNERWRLNSGAFVARAGDSSIVQGLANTTLPIRSQLTTGAGPGLLFDNDAVGATAFTAAAGEQIHIGQAFTVNQSLTAGWVAHRIAVTQTAEGSGDRSFLDFYNGVAGATRAFRVTSTGRVGIFDGEAIAGGVTSSPGLYFVGDTDTGIALVPAFSSTLKSISIIVDGGFAGAFSRNNNVGRITMDGGAADRPNYCFTAANNTGIWMPAINSIGFTTQGTHRWSMTDESLLAIGANGLIGTSSAGAGFIVRGNVSAAVTPAVSMLNDQVFSAASGAQRGVRMAHSIGQSGTAGFSTLALARVESALGSGEQNFIDAYGGAAGTTQIFRITSAGAVLGGAGAVGAPTFSFLADPDTGFYSIGAADVIGVSLGGILRWHFAGDEIRAQRSAGGFRQSTADSGLSYTGQIGASTTAASHSFLNSGQFNAAAGVQKGVQIAFGISQSGTAGLTLLEIQGNVVGGTGSGVYNLIDAQFGGSQFRVTSTGRTYMGDGDATLPGMSFQQDPDTGAYRAGADTMTFIGGTNPILTIAGGPKQAHLDQGGSAGAPSLAWSADPNTGFFNIGPDQIGFSTGGVQRLALSTTSLTSTLPILGPNGTAGAPTYSFSADTDNGLYYVTTNQVAISTGGVQAMRWETTVIASAYPIEFASAAMGTTAADTVRLGTPTTTGRPKFLALQDPYFGENFLATAFHDRQKFFLLPSGATTMVNAGFQMGTSGTVAYVTPTGTSFMTACQKNSFVTAASASSTADIHTTTPIVSQGSATTLLGFLFHARFAVGADYNLNTRLFVGLINTSATLAGATNPGALNTNRMVGVGLNSGSTTLNVYTNDAGGTPQTTSTGITVAANDAFDVWIWMPPNSTTRHVYINRVNGGAGTFSSSTFSFPPGANQWLHAHSWIATSEAVAKTLYVMRWAIEAGQ